VLRAVESGAPWEEALTQGLEGLGDRDRRLAHELAAGTLRAAGALDRVIAPFVVKGLGRVPQDLRAVLRLGAYQLTALQRIPEHAAVSTSVALARAVRGDRSAGFVNAVLRHVAAEAPPIVPGRGTHPGWLVSRWTGRYGPESTARLLQWNDTRPTLVLQPARWPLQQIRDALAAGGVETTEAPFGAGLVIRSRPDHITRPTQLAGYEEGGFVIQDPAQALVVRFFNVPEGALVLDLCAAPGGKTIALGRRAGLVVAAEKRRDRLPRLRANLLRAGSGVERLALADAMAPPFRPADAVVLDAPCLGTGVFARHPDARWRARPEALARLAGNAAALLSAAADVVRPGGLLCFSTCSLEPEENDVQIERFLAADGRFEREPGPLPTPAAPLLTPAGDFTTLPHRDGMDGAYAARLRRVA